LAADPPLSLSEAQSRGLTRIRLACAKCGRRGDYSVSRLRERFGHDASMIEVRETLSANCERKQTNNTNDFCGAMFEW
jgi:hypothetical protein